MQEIADGDQDAGRASRAPRARELFRRSGVNVSTVTLRKALREGALTA